MLLKLDCPADRVKALLRKFQNLGMITTKSNNRFTVLRVVKYDEYQSNFCPADVQPVSSAKPVTPTPSGDMCPADVQPVSTDNNILNNLLPNGSKYVATANEKTAERQTVFPVKKSGTLCGNVYRMQEAGMPSPLSAVS